MASPPATTEAPSNSTATTSENNQNEFRIFKIDSPSNFGATKDTEDSTTEGSATGTDSGVDKDCEPLMQFPPTSKTIKKRKLNGYVRYLLELQM